MVRSTCMLAGLALALGALASSARAAPLAGRALQGVPAAVGVPHAHMAVTSSFARVHAIVARQRADVSS